MAALLIENLQQTKTSFLTAVRAIELVLLSAGLIYTILFIKGAVVSTSYIDFMSIFRSWLSSPLCICIFIHFVVILIAVSSFFHHQRIDNDSDVEDGGDDSFEDYDLHSALSPSLSPPPVQINQKKHLQQRKPNKDFAVAAVATKNGTGRKIFKIETSSLKNHDTEETYSTVKTVDESCHQQAVFADFSRLTKAKEIKNAQTRNAGGKIRTTEQCSRDINFAEVTDHYSAQASFTDLPDFGESKEIKKARSLGSSNPVKTILIPTEKTTTNYAQTTSRNGTKNQTKKQLENEDVDDEYDTMEATWRAIMKKTKPQEKQLQKSETWPKAETLVAAEDRHKIDGEDNMSLPLPSSGREKELRKSMKFNDTVTITCRGGLRRDPSVNLEELNQRFDSFIQKFNHEMRLQRQESDQRYLDMISRGL